MHEYAINCTVPLGHENPQIIEVTVARVDARKVCKAVKAGLIIDSPGLFPEFPAYAVCTVSIPTEQVAKARANARCD